MVDLGCGFSAPLLSRFAGVIERGIGFDLVVQNGHPAGNLELHAQPVDEPLPLPDACADLVTCLAVIEHVSSPAVLVRESHRILRPGGKFVVTTPSRSAKPILELIAKLRIIDPEEILDHKRYYTRDTLRTQLIDGGYFPSGVHVGRFEGGLNLWSVARKGDALRSSAR